MENNTIQKISLDLIDDPRLAMRTEIDDDDLEELVRDMREVGLIQPITLRKIGERYEIIAGHRRTRAARLLGWALIDSKVVNATDEQALAMRLIENSSRRDVDPVDEACFIGEIMKKYNKTADDISKIMHRSLSWVDARLEVFNMPHSLQEVLKLKKIPLGSALWLNKIDDEKVREDYARMAGAQGLNVRRAQYWYETWKAGRAPQNPENIPEQPAGEIRKSEPLLDTCLICAEKDNVDNFSMYCAHPQCVEKFFEIKDSVASPAAPQ